MSFRHVRVRNSNQKTMSPSSLVSVCETNTNDQFEPSFRDNRDRETRNKKQRRYQHVGTRRRNKTGMLPALSIRLFVRI